MPETPTQSVVTPLIKLGRYEIAAEIGRGAMGTVYKANDPLIERTIALKTIRLDLSHQANQAFEERFYREAKSAGRLNHPNIVTIYDVGKTGDTAYIAMEYLEGESLDSLLEKHTPLTPARLTQIALQIANGLAYAHQHGVIHRDIKPANIILMRRGGIVKITDFGIAHIPTSAQTESGALLGSPRYMSPEQVQGKIVDGRSDVFSLGVVLYEILTGHTPFGGDNLSAILYNIMHYQPVLPSCAGPGVSEAFDPIVMRALAKSPSERYQTAREMAADLRALRGSMGGLEAPINTGSGIADSLRARTRQADKALLRTLSTMISMGIATVAVLAIIALMVTADSAQAPQNPPAAVIPPRIAVLGPQLMQKPAKTPRSQAPHNKSPKKSTRPNQLAITALDKKIQALKVTRAELLAKYTELHPDVVIATQQIKRLEKEKRKLAQEKG